MYDSVIITQMEEYPDNVKPTGKCILGIGAGDVNTKIVTNAKAMEELISDDFHYYNFKFTLSKPEYIKFKINYNSLPNQCGAVIITSFCGITIHNYSRFELSDVYGVLPNGYYTKQLDFKVIEKDKTLMKFIFDKFSKVFTQGRSCGEGEILPLQLVIEGYYQAIRKAMIDQRTDTVYFTDNISEGKLVSAKRFIENMTMGKNSYPGSLTDLCLMLNGYKDFRSWIGEYSYNNNSQRYITSGCIYTIKIKDRNIEHKKAIDELLDMAGGHNLKGSTIRPDKS